MTSTYPMDTTVNTRKFVIASVTPQKPLKHHAHSAKYFVTKIDWNIASESPRT